MGLHAIRLYLEPNPGGVYTITSPDVPGLVTERRTPDEIQANVQEALGALVAAWRKLERDIPPALRPILTDRPQAVEAFSSRFAGPLGQLPRLALQRLDVLHFGPRNQPDPIEL